MHTYTRTHARPDILPKVLARINKMNYSHILAPFYCQAAETRTSHATKRAHAFTNDKQKPILVEKPKQISKKAATALTVSLQ